ncbi:MAG: hypothetical protein P1U30_03210 [Phycisphaerales bacterium]|jgi:hypothetical protein|nr:hypothetical protein [Phycisphaerales bacterium]|tara:strand:- start:96571 stop:96825 length:255 start_codon:yes stop_codon:yes gene_type:complete
MSDTATDYEIGSRVRVTQQVIMSNEGKLTSVEGVVLRVGQQKTGSWFAHGRDKKLWLDRLELRKDDGELVVVNLDQYSRVEVIG